MATASDALQIARSLLNDDLATQWPDAILIPKLRIAYRELQAELTLNSIPVVKAQSAVLTVNVGDVTLGVLQPVDLIEPLSMKERAFGGAVSDFADMQQVSFLPQVERQTDLIYWAWLSGVITFVGATTKREVLLRYTRSLTLPLTINDPIDLVSGELFLGPQIAYMISGDKRFAVQAASALDKIIRTNVKGMQGIARRRLPYRYRGQSRMGAI